MPARDMRLGDGRWTIEAYARNLTDERYAVNRNTELPLLSFLPPFAYDETTTTFGAPRMYGREGHDPVLSSRRANG